ncbi:hypothetical protein G6F68_021335 [Rhizopus microsporus]|nr:hypothetical protein G6F68_021335 [Rhizopus microsporus]
MLNNMEKLLIIMLLLTQEDETFCTVYSKSCQDKMEKTKEYRRIGEAVKPQVRNAEDTAFEEVYHQGYQWDASRI